jgi:acyl-CoA thioester hydrolase
MEIEDGVLLAVAEAQCRYRAPARFDDEVIVKTWVAEANKRMVTFAYEMRLAETETVLAVGSTRHIFVNLKMERTRMPDKYRPLFGLGPATGEDDSVSK